MTDDSATLREMAEQALADHAECSGCRKHHAEQHTIGQPAFERKYGISLADICAEFARLSTDEKMKEEMRCL